MTNPDSSPPQPLQRTAIEESSLALSGIVGAAQYLSPQHGDFSPVAAALAQSKSPQQAVEQRLSCHLATLDALFYNLLEKSKHQPDPDSATAYVEVALKAQEAVRKTALALHTIRSPKQPSVYVQQYIQQQLNQLIQEGGKSHAAMDSRSKGIAAAENSAVEALDTIDRSDITGGQEEGQLELLQA